MKNAKQIKRKVLNELIQEIVNNEFDYYLLESGAGLSSAPLYQAFVIPFTNAANVIKGEVQKTGARVKGTLGRGLIGVGSVLLPFIKNAPFSGGKTWNETIKGSRENQKKSIGQIDQKYAASYEAVREAFTSPDAAFLAFAYNPGLYLGTAFATNAIGGSLSTVGGILGRDLTSGYNSWLRNNLGILRPGGKATYQGDISGGVGPGSDYGVDGGSYEELEEQVQDINKTYSTTYSKTLSSIKGNTKIPNELKPVFEEMLKNIAEIKLQGNQRQQIQYRLNKINSLQQAINKFNPVDILVANKLPTKKEDLANLINNTPEAKQIIDASIKAAENNPLNFSPELPETFEKWSKKNPNEAKQFWETIKKQNPDFKEKKLEELSSDEKKTLETEYEKLINQINNPENKKQQEESYRKTLNDAGIRPDIIDRVVAASFSK